MLQITRSGLKVFMIDLKQTIFTVLLLVCSFSVQADSLIIETCRQAESQEARIACLEAALADRNTGLGEQESDAAGTIPGTQADVAVSGDTPRPDAVEEVQADDTTLAAERVAGQAGTPDRSQSEQGNAQGLRVARYEVVPFRRLEVHLVNGQVWRQINADTQQLRASLKRNQTVDIEGSLLSGYKMRLNEMRRTMRVRRVR